MRSDEDDGMPDPRITALSRWIITQGAQGECPSWYPASVAADILHAPLWEVMERSVWYQELAHIKANAERNAQIEIQKLQQKGYL